MVSKKLEQLLKNKTAREGFFRNGKWYYTGISTKKKR